MKRALVTGSAGFVGRHMVRELEHRGYEVDGWDLATGRDALELFRDDDAPRYDLVVHCAYHVGGRAAIDGEPRLLAKNLELDAGMFDWAYRTGQRRVLYFSSSAAYPIGLQDGGPDSRLLAEDDISFGGVTLGRPDSRYGWAKITGEHLARAAADVGVPVHVFRPMSGYGEDQDETYPFRAILERARRREDPFVVWGPGTQVRDWIHIDDVIAGIFAVVEADERRPVNLCTGRGLSMLELAALACEASGYRPTFEPRPDKPTGVMYRVGDPTRLNLYHRTAVTIEEGVERAVATHAYA
ncbi:NAD-dependent epimerase/dehydratase family protein [Dactylosporangium sp. CA-139066]|uniref:NAD-dependent epimerase/dehydratase family protein n=1 Tax=Dactylosporangium sp. CA-139066 TaxID=3239930 RepID=UPI003D9028A6